VLVSGVSGSGKSSTVAAMVHHINRTQHKHVVTIENPIEFLHRDLSCSITQREVGVDTESLAVGLRAALRQDPDVVVLGEMADQEAIDTAIKGAETGHLVIASIPTPDVVTTIERVIATLPGEEREIGRMRFSEALRAIVSQQLLPLKDGKGRVAAVEVLVATPAVRECLKNASRTGEVRRIIAEGKNQVGTQTYDQHVAELVEAGLITADTAKAAVAVSASPPSAAKRGSKQAASA
jgi:twitching motility protein PilT